MTLFNFIAHWRNRCKPARMSSAFFQTAGAAQSYLWDLANTYHECKACGLLTFRWAELRTQPRTVTHEEQGQHDRMMDRLTYGRLIQRGAMSINEVRAMEPRRILPPPPPPPPAPPAPPLDYMGGGFRKNGKSHFIGLDLSNGEDSTSIVCQSPPTPRPSFRMFDEVHSTPDWRVVHRRYELPPVSPAAWPIWLFIAAMLALAWVMAHQ